MTKALLLILLAVSNLPAAPAQSPFRFEGVESADVLPGGTVTVKGSGLREAASAGLKVTVSGRPVTVLALHDGSLTLRLPEQIKPGIAILEVAAPGHGPVSIRLRVGRSPSAKQPHAEEGDLPPDGRCLSGSVVSIARSLARQASRLPDEVTIGEIRLCPTCTYKAPIFVAFADKLEAARVDGLNVDVCFDSVGTMNLVRLRP